MEDVLRSGVQLKGVTSFVGLVELLEARAGRNRTSKMWTDNLVKTVIIMMNFSRGGHEWNWVLHLLAAEAMLPYFRAAGCHNSARYAAFYVHERTRSGVDEETSAWYIRAPRNRHLQLNLDGHVHRNNIHADVARTDRSNMGSYRLPSDGEVGS